MKRFNVLVATTLLASSSIVYAANPPNNCKTGAVFSSNASGSSEQCDHSGCGDFEYDFDVDYLATVSEKYVLIGEDTRVKGDGAFYFSRSDTITFHDSINGEVGMDNANFEGNAYYNYTISNNIWQAGQIWLWTTKNSGDGLPTPWCSKKQVYLHKAPKLNIQISKTENTTPDGGVSSTYLNIDANPAVGTFSKAVQEGVGYTVKWYYRSSLSTPWQVLSNDSDSIGQEFFHAVTYFKVILNDGVHETEEQFHVQTSKPGANASPCNSKPWLDFC